MQRNKNNLVLLVERLLLLNVLYSFCRLLFFLFNLSYFSDVSAGSLLKDFLVGIRFDLVAIIISNIVFIILHLNPFSFFYSRVYQLVLKIIFLSVNIIFLLFSCIDFGLFRFSGKHSTSGALRVMSFGEDFMNTVPGMIADFWYVLLIFFALSIILTWRYSKISIEKYHGSATPLKNDWVSKLKKLGIYLLTIGLVIIGFRGGIQFKPVTIITASSYGSSKDIALILNTPFTILKTFNKSSLDEVNYFSEKEAESISPVVHHYHSMLPFNKANVVLIILESFGKEYFGSLNNREGYTPFLDSLIHESLVFDHAFANGKRSIEGIPSIVAGIPPLMDEPFISSAYSGNSINSIASLLKMKGYATSFFHGGTNGTMNFDNFTRLAGYQSYFGRREYNDDKDFDGTWGIYDGPFLQRFADRLNTMPQPFFSTLFTLSSHHPYAIPEKDRARFSSGTLPIHQSIRYADDALRIFFHQVSKMSWFDNTLFVLVADHTALSEESFYQNNVGIFSIPLIFYQHNSHLKGLSDQTAQQIDIMPSILDYLHFDQPFFSLGESVFDSTADHFAVSYFNDSYQIISNNYSLMLDTLKNNFLYHYTADTLLLHNVSASEPVITKKLETKLKAFIQSYNHALIQNKMSVDGK